MTSRTFASHTRRILAALILTLSPAWAGKGILELDSKPGGAEAFVDGKKKGLTPETDGQKLTMELEEGDHEVVVKKAGVGEKKKSIFVGEGVIQPLTLTIEAGPYENSLGMKFVPVPTTQILMCVHETRNKDYAAYAAANSGVDTKWKEVVFDFGDKGKKKLTNETQHPVVNVSWDDAKGFCDWLGTKDGKTYRLPTDHEWSCAVGIGDQENAKASPKDKNGKVAWFPWSGGYPPPKDNVGNYWDTSGIEKGLWTSKDLKGYNDGYPLTAPVMSFPANKLGIYDLSGNVWEWCQDLYQPDEQYCVLRGASWRTYGRDYLASSFRVSCAPVDRNNDLGFRVVVVVSGSGGSAP